MPSLEGSKLAAPPEAGRRLRAIVNNHWLNLAAGLMMIIVSLDEVLATFSGGLQLGEMDANHGIVVAGLLHILKALPDLLEGLEHLER